MKLFLLLAVIGSTQAALHSFTLQGTDPSKTILNDGATYKANHGAATTHCSGCEEIANMQPGMMLTCKTPTTVIKFKGNLQANGEAKVNGGCKLGYFLGPTSSGGDANTSSTCTACETGCLICSSATVCTRAAAGYYFDTDHTGTSDVVQCTASSDEQCKAHATKKIGSALGTGTACPAGVNLSTGANTTQSTGVLTHTSSASTGCESCPNGKGPASAGVAGCADCVAVDNAATGSTLTCTYGSPATVSVLGAAASGPHQGRKCKPEYGWVPNATTASEECKPCPSNCYTCDITASGSTSSSVGACTKPNAGFYMNSSTPAACSATTATTCNDAGPAGLHHTHLTPAEMCPAGNAYLMQPGNATDGNLTVCGGTYTDMSSFAADKCRVATGDCAVGNIIKMSTDASGNALTGADLDRRVITGCSTADSSMKVATFAPALSAVTGAVSKYTILNGTGCATCGPNKVSKASGTDGCQDCPTVNNIATGATRTCTTGANAATNAVIVAATSGAHNGRKCAPGYGWVPNGSTTSQECKACPSNCYTCEGSGTDASVGACSKPNEGYYMASTTPTECTPKSAADCAAVQDTTKFPVAKNVVCAANNGLTANISLDNGCNEYAKACPVSASPAGVAAPGVVATLLAAVAVALRM